MPKEYTVDGAQLECDKGTKPSNLKVSKRTVLLGGKFKANIGDCTPYDNVPPFCMCNSKTNPEVIAANGAPVACTPTCTEWCGGKSDVLVQGQRALLTGDTAFCPFGAGIIKVKTSGQEGGTQGQNSETQLTSTPIFSKTFDDWDDMKAAHKGTVVAFVKNNKPLGAPVPKKWLNKGGKLTIEELPNGKKVWHYTSTSGATVPYVPVPPPPHIKFTSEYLHPDEDIACFSIGEFTGDRGSDMVKVLAKLKTMNVDSVPKGYIVHHDIESGAIQLVREDVHSEFSHYGGHYYNKKQ